MFSNPTSRTAVLFHHDFIIVLVANSGTLPRSTTGLNHHWSKCLSAWISLCFFYKEIFMPTRVPIIKTIAFKTEELKDGLQKGNSNNNQVEIVGKNITLRDIVIVIGASGTVWKGRIRQALTDNTYICDDLECLEAEPTEEVKPPTAKKDAKKRPLDGGGVEDLSTTVINPTNGSSPPITQPNVPIIFP